MLDTLLFTAGVTLPVCVMLLSGFLLYKAGFIDNHFISVSSRLVFNFCMPAVLFFSLSSVGDSGPLDANIITFALLSSIGGFFLAWLLSLKVVPEWKDRGVFIQGAARGNLAIVGLALADNLYGEQGIALMSLMMAVTIPVYNVLSIIFLSYYSQGQKQGIALKNVAKDIVSNPLIIAVAAGLSFSFTGYNLPVVVDKVGNYFAQITLPLALLGVGGTLKLKALRKASMPSLWASTTKVVLLPLFTIPIAILSGFEGSALGVVFLMMSCPTAAASFVMAKATGGNSELAANVIALTTLLSMPLISVGLVVLRAQGVI